MERKLELKDPGRKRISRRYINRLFQGIACLHWEIDYFMISRLSYKRSTQSWNLSCHIGIPIRWWMSVAFFFPIWGCRSWLPHTSWVGRSIERKTCKLVGFLSYPSEGQFPWQGFQSALRFTTLAESENGVVGERVDKWKSINILPFVGCYFSLASLFWWLWGKGCNPWIHEWVFKKLEDVCQTYELARLCKWKAVVFCFLQSYDSLKRSAMASQSYVVREQISGLITIRRLNPVAVLVQVFPENPIGKHTAFVDSSGAALSIDFPNDWWEADGRRRSEQWKTGPWLLRVYRGLCCTVTSGL